MPQASSSVIHATEAVPVESGRLSALTALTFYAPDLNKIAETIRRSQERGVEDPSRPSDQLWATPEGDILTGTVVDPEAAQRLTRITQETFYGH
jgi:hypothetical protein